MTQEMLLDPSPDDWLMYSRTYDAQRFSPLKQVNRGNVGQLRMAWTRGLGPGTRATKRCTAILSVDEGTSHPESPPR